MYKHILVPTDGTELSKLAVQRSLDLAKALGAKVTVVRVSGKPAHLVVEGTCESSRTNDFPYKR